MMCPRGSVQDASDPTQCVCSADGTVTDAGARYTTDAPCDRCAHTHYAVSVDANATVCAPCGSGASQHDLSAATLGQGLGARCACDAGLEDASQPECNDRTGAGRGHVPLGNDWTGAGIPPSLCDNGAPPGKFRVRAGCVPGRPCCSSLASGVPPGESR